MELNYTFKHNEGSYSIQKLNQDDLIKMDKLCTACSDFYEMSEGKKPDKESAKEILYELPPNYTYDKKYVLGVFKNKVDLIAIIEFIQDYPVKNEWIIGLLMIHPEERGQGLGRIIHEYIIKIVKQYLAEKLRVAVFEDNVNGIKFWEKLGYFEVKKKSVKVGLKEHVVRAMNLKI